MRRGWGRRLLAAQMAVVWVGGLGLASCGGRGVALGTTSSPCFHALPPAATSVHHRGRLVGVQLVPASRLRRHAPQASILGLQKVCLVAFSGHFTPADVERPVDQRTGPYAIVAVRPDGSRVIGSVIVEKLPLTFRHSV